MATTKTATKQVQIIARYALKRHAILTGVVCYKVRSSNGHDEYCTTLVNGKATGCSCPAYKPCYHMIQLEAIEQERRATAAHEAFITASNIVAKPGQTPVQCKRTPVTPEQIETLIQDHELGLLALLNHFEPDYAVICKPKADPESTYERMLNAALNGPRAFSLLR